MTGWRLGWLVVPQAMVGAVEKLSQNLFICASARAKHAALACFQPDTLAIYEAHRIEFKRRRDYIVPALRSIGFGVPVVPDGAFYVYADTRRACIIPPPATAARSRTRCCTMQASCSCRARISGFMRPSAICDCLTRPRIRSWKKPFKGSAICSDDKPNGPPARCGTQAKQKASEGAFSFPPRETAQTLTRRSSAEFRGCDMLRCPRRWCRSSLALPSCASDFFGVSMVTWTRLPASGNADASTCFGAA